MPRRTLRRVSTHLCQSLLSVPLKPVFPIPPPNPHMRRFVNLLALAVILAGLSGVVLGMLGGRRLAFDILAHFRLHFLALGGVGAVVWLWPWRGRLLALMLGLAAIPVVIGLQPMLHRITGEETQARAQSTPRTLSIMSYNSWAANRDIRPLEAHIRATRPDIVILLEFGASKRAMLARLKRLYPHQTGCVGVKSCHIALLSKQPWARAGAKAAGPANPPYVWARFGRRHGGVTIIGTHLTRPPFMRAQLAQVRGLARFIKTRNSPLIVAGDFNATPWSVMYRSFTRLTGLEPASAGVPSWPVFSAALAQLAIDHVFVSRGITRRSHGVGPRLGSDHLPVHVTVTLPGV